MIPFLVLIIVFVLSQFIIKLNSKNYHFSLSGRIAMAAMLIFTAIGHFMYAKGMTMMIPNFIPYKLELVYLTGVLEVAMGTGLLIKSTSNFSGRALMAFLVLIFPANVYAAMHQVNYQEANFEGDDLSYLWIRVPLQLFFIGWTYLSAVKYNQPPAPKTKSFTSVRNLH